jgi:sulfur-carrier protein adenylyltransferase/sulfurtransferase
MAIATTIYEPRYQRQLLLKGWGPSAQEKLHQAKILVVGAGGLGCPVLQYLAGAGTGTIGIVDDDRIAETDLHRQILYTVADIGHLKTAVATEWLGRQNPDVCIKGYPFRFTGDNAQEVVEQFDLVIDASDNFGTRYLIDDVCRLLGKPWIYGSVSRFEGQVAVFGKAGAATIRPVHYRDLFPDPPAPGEVFSCEEAGVLGVVAGITGCLQAMEALKVVTGEGDPLQGRVLTYHALHNTFYEMEVRPSGAFWEPSSLNALRSWPYGL